MTHNFDPSHNPDTPNRCLRCPYRRTGPTHNPGGPYPLPLPKPPPPTGVGQVPYKSDALGSFTQYQKEEG